jgi:hypothetical protein
MVVMDVLTLMGLAGAALMVVALLVSDPYTTLVRDSDPCVGSAGPGDEMDEEETEQLRQAVEAIRADRARRGLTASRL